MRATQGHDHAASPISVFVFMELKSPHFAQVFHVPTTLVHGKTRLLRRTWAARVTLDPENAERYLFAKSKLIDRLVDALGCRTATSSLFGKHRDGRDVCAIGTVQTSRACAGDAVLTRSCTEDDGDPGRAWGVTAPVEQWRRGDGHQGALPMVGQGIGALDGYRKIDATLLARMALPIALWQARLARTTWAASPYSAQHLVKRRSNRG